METINGKPIADMTNREINAYFRSIDDSNLWPICGKFNATNRAIRRLQKYQREGMVINPGLEYYCALEREISNIVNSIY